MLGRRVVHHVQEVIVLHAQVSHAAELIGVGDGC